jgi:methylmalonyl-CoA/ethylmalonyl-CoA epimerase
MVERISHFGIVVQDLDAAVRLWTEAYGFKEFQRLDIPAEGIRSALLSPGGTAGEMAIELMEPADKSDMSNAVARRLARAGEGFYHVALEVEDVEGSGPALAERGMTVLDRLPAVPGDAMRWVVHPKDSNGVLVELLQSRGAD